MKSYKKQFRHNLGSKKERSAHFGHRHARNPAFSLKQKGSLALETALALPLFLLFCMTLCSFLLLLSLEGDIRVSLGETARSMGKKAYILEHMAESGQEGSMMDEESAALMQAGINPTTIKVWLLKDGALRNAVGNSRIPGGIGGIYTGESSYDPEERILDLVVQYDYVIPGLPRFWGNLRLLQRMRSHVWCGASLEKAAGGKEAGKTETVYVTETGTVYHLSPSCPYLDLSIHSVSFQSLAGRRNHSGAKYYPCEECARGGHGDMVYITDYGTVWHTSLGCSGLKRTVIEKDIKEIDGMRICTKCKKGISHTH